jgi:hypothetical protein
MQRHALLPIPEVWRLSNGSNRSLAVETFEHEVQFVNLEDDLPWVPHRLSGVVRPTQTPHEYIPQEYNVLLREYNVLLRCRPATPDYQIFLEIFNPLTYKNMQAAFSSRSRNLPKTAVAYAPSSAAKAGRCFDSLAANAVRGPISRIFTSTHEIFLQTAGLQDGASHCAKILSSMYAALNSDPSDPDVIIKLDISNAFNALCRQPTLDVLGGNASCYCACGLKEGDNIETVCGELRNMFEYFRAMRTTKSHLRNFDYCGKVLDAWRKNPKP